MKKDYERYLNELFSKDCVAVQDAYNKFYYLKGGKISEDQILTAYISNRLGSLMRRYDPTRFNVGYNEWVQSKQKVR